MKINSPNWNVANTENLYKNFKQKFDTSSESDLSLSTQELISFQKAERNPESMKSLLSDSESDVLKLLFGENEKNKELHFYGNKKPKSVNSGFFLDVKG